MGCLYYIPARRFPDKRVPDTLKSRRVVGDGAVCLESMGLGHLDGAMLHFRGVNGGGPDGGAGLVIGLGGSAAEVGYYPERQTWQACNGGSVYIGWSATPGPEVFLRSNAPLPEGPSCAVVLGDGRVWEFAPTAALPEVARFDAAGELAWTPRPEDAAHYAASKWLMDFFLSGESRGLEESLERIAICLGARYHVSVLEVLALGLFRTDLLTACVCACLGLDLDEVEGKKNAEPA